MKLTIMVEGREALPVRAIPYVSGWNMSPDMVATGLAHTDSSRRFRNIFGYRIVDGAIVAVRPMQWDSVVVALNGLDERLPTGNDGYSEWRNEAPKLLPEGVFVWLDDFAAAYGKAFSKEHWICDDRDGERELDFLPMIDQSTLALVMAGFNRCNLPGASDGASDRKEEDVHHKKCETPGTYEYMVRLSRQIGESWMEAERKENRKVGVAAIAKYVEDRLKKEDIRGPRGDYWGWETIKKEALTGITGRKANGKK